MAERVAEDWFVKMIRHAAVAGSCRSYARTEIQAASGLLKAADRHSALAGAMLNRWLDDRPAELARAAVRTSAPEPGAERRDVSR